MKNCVAVVTVSLALFPLVAGGALFARFVVRSTCLRCGFPALRTHYFGHGPQTDECLWCSYIQDAECQPVTR